MQTHGSLENEILNAVWSIEEDGSGAETISVNEVQDSINQTGNIRAYTTVKTVMDRLVDKKILNRQKKGKKFFYSSAFSRNEMAKNAIRHIAGQYFNNDFRLFINTLEKEYQGAHK